MFKVWYVYFTQELLSSVFFQVLTFRWCCSSTPGTISTQTQLWQCKVSDFHIKECMIPCGIWAPHCWQRGFFRLRASRFSLCSCSTTLRVSGTAGNCKSHRSSISKLGDKTWRTWQRGPQTRATQWNGLFGTGSPRFSRICINSPWRTRTGVPDAIRNQLSLSCSSGTIRSGAALVCSPDCTTAYSSYAAFALQMTVRKSIKCLL